MSENSSTFLSILDTWPDYFENPDEGLGTTYERFILHRYFERLVKSYPVQSVLEVPSFGMTGVSGINSLWWGYKGVPTTVVDTDEERVEKSKNVWKKLQYSADFRVVDNIHQLPFDDKSFDLSWNFAALWFVQDMARFVAELSRVTRNVIFICVPNTAGLGFKLRSFFNKDEVSGFFPKQIWPKSFDPEFEQAGWKLIDRGYLDIPPWPDIAMKKEDMLRKAGLGFLVKEEESGQPAFEKKYIVEWFSGEKPQLEEEILKYDFLEKIPSPFKQLWGHHRWFIFEPV